VSGAADPGRWRRDDLRAEILSRAAYARGVLAVGAGSRGRGQAGWRGVLSGGEAAVLVAVGEEGRGSTWLVRGRLWSIGPSRVVGMAFPRAVRVRSGGPAGSIIGGRDDGTPVLSCGLCGGVLGCREEGGLRVGLDVELARHPLAPSWVAVGGA
jgi:hypothetical protein